MVSQLPNPKITTLLPHPLTFTNFLPLCSERRKGHGTVELSLPKRDASNAVLLKLIGVDRVFPEP